MGIGVQPNCCDKFWYARHDEGAGGPGMWWGPRDPSTLQLSNSAFWYSPTVSGLVGNFPGTDSVAKKAYVPWAYVKAGTVTTGVSLIDIRFDAYYRPDTFQTTMIGPFNAASIGVTFQAVSVSPKDGKMSIYGRDSGGGTDTLFIANKDGTGLSTVKVFSFTSPTTPTPRTGQSRLGIRIFRAAGIGTLITSANDFFTVSGNPYQRFDMRLVTDYGSETILKQNNINTNSGNDFDWYIGPTYSYFDNRVYYVECIRTGGVGLGTSYLKSIPVTGGAETTHYSIADAGSIGGLCCDNQRGILYFYSQKFSAQSFTNDTGLICSLDMASGSLNAPLFDRAYTLLSLGPAASTRDGCWIQWGSGFINPSDHW